METPSSSSSSSSSSFSFSPPTVLYADEKKRKSVVEQSIRDAAETKDLFDLNMPWQQELETPPSPSSSSSSSSFSFPSPPPEMWGDESKRKSAAEQPIQYDSDEMTEAQDSGLGRPFLPHKKRKYQAKLLIQENAPIGKEYKTEATKKTQLSGSFSHCAPGDAPASAPTTPVGGQDSDQDQTSPRNTANLRAKSRLSKIGSL